MRQVIVSAVFALLGSVATQNAPNWAAGWDSAALTVSVWNTRTESNTDAALARLAMGVGNVQALASREHKPRRWDATRERRRVDAAMGEAAGFTHPVSMDVQKGRSATAPDNAKTTLPTK